MFSESLVLKILFLILLNHVLFTSLHVRAVERYIGETNRHFNAHLISFGTKIPTVLNTSVLLKGVRRSAIFLLLRFSGIDYASNYSQLEIKDAC